MLVRLPDSLRTLSLTTGSLFEEPKIYQNLIDLEAW